MLGKRVHGEVRFGKHEHASHTTGHGEPMPQRFTHRVERELLDQCIEQPFERVHVAESHGVAPVRLDDPFIAVHQRSRLTRRLRL